MAKTFADVEKQIRDLDAKIKLLGGKGFPDLDKAILSMSGNLQQAEAFASLLYDKASDLENVFSNISTTLQNVVRDLDKSTKTTTLITRGFNKLESIASKLVEHVNEEELLTVKQLKGIQKQYWQERDLLKSTQDVKQLNKIYLGKYSETNIDEFHAEAFMEYKLSANPSKYAKLVGKLIDKNFKK